jgi:hypothetical protein
MTASQFVVCVVSGVVTALLVMGWWPTALIIIAVAYVWLIGYELRWLQRRKRDKEGP